MIQPKRAVGCFTFLAFGLTLAGTALILIYRPSLHFVGAWLIAINVVTFFIFAYDKTIAMVDPKAGRVPEALLLVLTFLGGTAGALAAMLLFDHKTSKPSFYWWFVFVVLIQIALVGLYFAELKPALGGG